MSLDMEELLGEGERLADQQDNAGGNFLNNFVRMPEKQGSVVVRILPPAKSGMFDREKNPLFQWTRTHKVNNKTLHCPRVFTKVGEIKRWVSPTGKPEDDCPICLYYSSLWKRIEKLQKGAERTKLEEKARSLKAAERYYYNVIVRSEYDPETQQVATNVGPKILSVGVKLHAKIIQAILGNKELGLKSMGDITDVSGKTGRDFRIVKTIEKSNGQTFPAYDSSVFEETSPLGTPEEVQEWLGKLHDLTKLRTLKPIKDMAHQLKIHNGVIPDSQSEFNASEFERSESAGETQAHVETKRAAQPVANEPRNEKSAASDADSDAGTTESGTGESLAADEFMSQLRNM